MKRILYPIIFFISQSLYAGVPTQPVNIVNHSTAGVSMATPFYTVCVSSDLTHLESCGGSGGSGGEPLFLASPAAGITSDNINNWEYTYNTVSTSAINWNEVYSWGNHADAGYADALEVATDTNTLKSEISGLVYSTGSAMTGPLTNTSTITANSLHAPNIHNNAGLITSPVITNTATPYDISVGTSSCILFPSPDYNSGGRERYFVSGSTLTLVEGFNHVYLDYTGGSPVYGSATTETNTDYSDRVPVADIFIEDGEIDYLLQYGTPGLGGIEKNLHRVYTLRRFEKESGLNLSETTGRVVNISAGVGWFGLDYRAVSSTASSSSNMHVYTHNAGGDWIKTATGSYVNNWYDTATGTIALTSNRYAVNWVYRNVTEAKSYEIDLLLGTGDYTLAQAQAATLPTPPASISSFYYPVGKIIVQKDAATAVSVQNFATSQLNYTSAQEHNDLLALQGGQAGEYYHMTEAEHTDLGIAKLPLSGGTMSGSIDADAYTLNTSSSVTGITEILWADGTVQTSSPSAGGGFANPATEDLEMGSYSINSSTGINAESYLIKGSTAVAVRVGAGGSYTHTHLGIQSGAAIRADGSQGEGNVFLGYQAGLTHQWGGENIFAGAYAASNSGTNIQKNTILGYLAGYSIADNRNVALGERAMFAGTSAHGNTALGTQACDNVTTGDSNICIGYNTDVPSATGSNQVNIGDGIYGGLTLGSTVTIIPNVNISSNVNAHQYYINGVEFISNPTASGIVIGELAGHNHTGILNTLMGYWSGRVTSNGTGNSMYGYGTGYYNTSGSNNCFFGTNAGLTNTTGNDNVAIGNTAMNAGYGSGQTRNVFIGSLSGRLGSSTAKSDNVGIGYSALYTLNSSSANVALGANAGYSTTGGGDNNVFLGYNAGYANTTGKNNIFIGSRAGDNNATGNNNIIIGVDRDNIADNVSIYLDIGGAITGYMDEVSTISFVGSVSAVSYVDRTPYPDNLEIAYEAVNSMKAKDGGLDHEAMSSFVKGGYIEKYVHHYENKTTEVYDTITKEEKEVTKAVPIYVEEQKIGRDMSATISAQNEVIKDLIKRIEILENTSVMVEQ